MTTSEPTTNAEIYAVRPTLRLLFCEGDSFLNLTMQITANPELFQITPVALGDYGVDQLFLEGRLIPKAPFFVRLDQPLQIHRAVLNGTTSMGDWWNPNLFRKVSQLEFIVTQRA